MIHHHRAYDIIVIISLDVWVSAWKVSVSRTFAIFFSFFKAVLFFRHLFVFCNSFLIGEARIAHENKMLINVTEHCNWMTPINFDHITCPVTTAVAAAAAATHQFVTHCIASNWAHAWIPKFVIHALTLCDKQRSVSRFETKKN